jgi:hypothetical protein
VHITLGPAHNPTFGKSGSPADQTDAATKLQA